MKLMDLASEAGITFRFTDPVWESVRLPLTRVPDWRPDISGPAREIIEEYITTSRMLAPEQIRKTITASNHTLSDLKELQRLFEKPVGRQIAGGRAAGDLLVSCEKSLAQIRQSEALLEAALGDKLFHRKYLLSQCIGVWEALGGEARTSTSTDGTTPTGPLIRFLMSISEVAELGITVYSAREAVRKHRRQLVAKMDVTSLEEAYQRLRAQ